MAQASACGSLCLRDRSCCYQIPQAEACATKIRASRNTRPNQSYEFAIFERPLGKNLSGNLIGAKRPSVTVPHRNAVAVEPLKQWHNDPSAASDLLPQLTNRRRSVVPNVLADQFGHALQTLCHQHHFRVDLYGLACLDQEPQGLL